MNKKEGKKPLEWRWTSAPITRDVLTPIEQAWGIQLPEDYIQCALVNHGGRPSKKCFDFPGRQEAVFNRLINIVPDDENIDTLLSVHADVKDRLSQKVYPFAEDPFGNLLCFSYQGGLAHEPTIVFWDHEAAYKDPGKATRRICDNFTQLLDMLYQPK